MTAQIVERDKSITELRRWKGMSSLLYYGIITSKSRRQHTEEYEWKGNCLLVERSRDR